MASGSGGSWIAFAALAFVVAGLSGVFATYALPIPMHRALAAEVAFDEAALAARGPNPDAAVAALAPTLTPFLGEGAASILHGAGPTESRIAAARAAMRADFLAEEEAIATRLRWLTIMVSLTGAVFVGVIVGSLSRRPTARID